MNLLNKVKVENTFRINAATAYEAAVIVSTEYSNRDSVVVEGIHGEESVFLITSTIRSSVYHDVVFVDHLADGKYRAEVGSVRLDGLELTHILGGDEAVNESKFYQSEDLDECLTEAEYSEGLEYWINDDKKEGSTKRMESYFKRKFHQVKMVNGVFQGV